VGSNIAVGCCGAVYEARLKPPIEQLNSDTISGKIIVIYLMTEFQFVGLINSQPSELTKTRREQFPLVMKIMFNYNLQSTPISIIHDTEQELVPVIDDIAKGLMRWCVCELFDIYK
jgi:hypothetical protein